MSYLSRISSVLKLSCERNSFKEFEDKIKWCLNIGNDGELKKSIKIERFYYILIDVNFNFKYFKI